MTDVQVRELQKEDLFNGFLTSLDSLRKTSDISKERAEEIFKKIASNEDHIIAVAVLDGKIVGSATLLIEQKFIHNGGLVGHIEDVVVDTNFQGKKIGKKIIEYLLERSKNRGCYKTILDCSDDV
ncbi:MAG: GNAT family N-acetyltransferase, partial [Nitrosopumilaceae archaeon]|nr:GNAT family N-acetyltransferase [Nitrosopumilaceae archaeon]NIU01503.1 GNAT family N-acetyltransferase [Nitrosopumilaceae archaeon]NIU87933.1 GNAT family N-acetyltransferase [Nitrosopumilaceae archaeon]NIV66214.1 GNAT family N-acetyltransferase [Nitrosopumilaceae archaeon]NIX62105.1 GNAT family N-acetyltransferase [Nitrosopumilaceae archaeon]